MFNYSKNSNLKMHFFQLSSIYSSDNFTDNPQFAGDTQQAAW